MKIDAAVSILTDKDGATLEIHDIDARICFLRLKMTPEMFTSALGRMAERPATECLIRDLDKLGKIHEHKNFEFELGDDIPGISRQCLAKQQVLKECPDGWLPDCSFSSQNSFIRKGGSMWAQTTIRRYVDKKGE